MQSRWKKAWPGALALVVCTLLVGRTLRQLARAPALNWDMLPAMALALEWSEDDPAEVHRRTYLAAREELPPAAFRELVAPGVRQARAQDPAAFAEHLPFQRARVLYTLSVAALHGLGAPLTAATWWIPLACLALSALFFLAWGLRYLPLGLAALFAAGLAHTPALLAQARLSTADGLATLCVALAAWAFVERRAFLAPAVLGLLALGARPDTLILIGCTALALFLLVPRAERPSAARLAAWLGLCALVGLGLSRWAGEYGWWPLMQISFVEKAVHPAALATRVDWAQYGAILAQQLAGLPGGGYTATPSGEVTGSSLLLLHAALGGLGLALALQRGERRLAALLSALLAAYLLRFFLFPQPWDRFYAPFYALVPLCLLALVMRAQRERA